MAGAGRLLARGRDADIFEYETGLVLRRSRQRSRVVEHEARVMEYAADHGFPVPRVHEVRSDGTEIVMERIDGPMMLDVVARRPYTLVHHANLLADLHDRLHELPAPDWLPRLDDPQGGQRGPRLLHLDLHPLNVMMTVRGPVVIDWTNAAGGDALTDVGLTYVLLTCPRAPVPWAVQVALRPFRLVMAQVFARRYPASQLRPRIAFAAELKMLDPNMDAVEVENCRRLAHRMRR